MGSKKERECGERAMNIRFECVVPIDRMCGDDDEDTALLQSQFAQAQAYLSSFGWCRRLREAWFGMGVGGVAAVFLVQIDALGTVDEWLWLVVGDIPSCYLVADQASTPTEALRMYCKLMEEWVSAVRSKHSLDDVFPVDAEPTLENAELLARRLRFIREFLL